MISAKEAATVRAGSGMSRRQGDRLAGSYVNFLITNGRVILPILDGNTDADALRIIQAISHITSWSACRRARSCWVAGTFCITQQIPCRRPRVA